MVGWRWRAAMGGGGAAESDGRRDAPAAEGSGSGNDVNGKMGGRRGWAGKGRREGVLSGGAAWRGVPNGRIGDWRRRGEAVTIRRTESAFTKLKTGSASVDRGKSGSGGAQALPKD